ncbi:MAG TPA: Hpt domain-containing protein [Sphingobacteriaceae bacterium]
MDKEIDLSYLRAIASDSNEFMIEMIDLFLGQTPEYFSQLQEAADNQNWKEVASLAHKIKPTLAFMGLNAARADIEDIEKKARLQEKPEEIAPRLDKMRSACEILFRKLKDVRTELAAGI